MHGPIHERLRAGEDKGEEDLVKKYNLEKFKEISTEDLYNLFEATVEKRKRKGGGPGLCCCCCSSS
jgi:hypothetical protein